MPSHTLHCNLLFDIIFAKCHPPMANDLDFSSNTEHSMGIIANQVNDANVFVRMLYTKECTNLFECDLGFIKLSHFQCHLAELVRGENIGIVQLYCLFGRKQNEKSTNKMRIIRVIGRPNLCQKLQCFLAFSSVFINKPDVLVTIVFDRI